MRNAILKEPPPSTSAGAFPTGSRSLDGEIHEQVKRGGRVGAAWRDYFHMILGGAHVPANAAKPKLIDSLWEAHQRFGLWTVAIEGRTAKRSTAIKNAKVTRLGVVSNAEGNVARDLDTAGLRRAVLGPSSTPTWSGIEKPDPGIFKHRDRRAGGRSPRARYSSAIYPPSTSRARGQPASTPILIDRHELYPDVGDPSNPDDPGATPAAARRPRSERVGVADVQLPVGGAVPADLRQETVVAGCVPSGASSGLPATGRGHRVSLKRLLLPKSARRRTRRLSLHGAMTPAPAVNDVSPSRLTCVPPVALFGRIDLPSPLSCKTERAGQDDRLQPPPQRTETL